MNFYFIDPDHDLFSVGFGDKPESEPEESIFEAAAKDRDVDGFAGQQLKSAAMATALVFVEEKDFTFEALDALVVGMVDLDGDEEVGDDEEQDYNDLLSGVADAFIELGASPENVAAFIDDEDDEQGEKLGKFLAKKLADVSIDDNQIISRYATRSGAVFEAAKKVVRNGKVILKKKRVKKYRMSAAQRQALKRARRKSNTAAARRNRAKAMRVRKQRGL